MSSMPPAGVAEPRSLCADVASLYNDPQRAPGYLNAVCDRIDRIDPLVRAFLPEEGRRERLLAAAADTRGRWRGIPVGVKDVIRVDGLPTRAGSAVPVEELTGPQASVVTRMTAAGAVIAGKTVTAEFAVAAPGPTVNPCRPGHTPGGSSSGSAAAVAAGLVPVALGTQTIASVIRPAAYCGVVGFKPTYGRVPSDGVIPNSPSLDTLGWFTARVADAAAAAEVICAGWRPAAATGKLPAIGIPSPRYLGQATAEARQAFHRQVGALLTAGSEVRHTMLFNDVDEISRRLFVINRWELAQTHRDWFGRYPSCYQPQTAAAIKQGMGIDQGDYLAALRWRQDLADAYHQAIADAGVDLWIAPAATSAAPTGLASTGNSIMGFAFSLVGVPVLSIQAGRDRHGLPWGVQCGGAAAADEALLAFGAEIETIMDDVSVTGS